jgi:hypothetical protein
MDALNDTVDSLNIETFAGPDCDPADVRPHFFASPYHGADHVAGLKAGGLLGPHQGAARKA